MWQNNRNFVGLPWNFEVPKLDKIYEITDIYWNYKNFTKLPNYQNFVKLTNSRNFIKLPKLGKIKKMIGI